MATQKENKHSVLSILVVLVIFGSLAALVFIPVELFTSVREKEQFHIREWLGNETDQWVMFKIIDLLRMANAEGLQSLDAAAISGNSKLDAWLMQRVYSALVWSHVVLYRGGLLLMWLGFGIPVLIAVCMDGHYAREISKATFSSQSPIMHKAGMDLSKWSMAGVILWLFLPVHVTMLVAPIGIALYGVGIWIWYANMQKRL